MKIGIDARTIFSPQPRGTGRNLFDAYRLIPALRPDWTFHLYHQRPAAACPLVCGAAEADRPEESAWPANVALRRIDIPGDRLNLWFQLRLPVAAWRDRLDLLHLPANAAPAWCPVPTVVTVHDLVPLKIADELPPPARERFRRGVLRAARTARHIITPSATTRDELCGEFGVCADRVTVIPWAADRLIAGMSDATSSSAFHAVRRRYQLHRPWMLNFSGPTRRKNAAGLLAGFAQLPAEIRAVCDLVLVGCATSEFQAELAAMAQTLGISEHCRFLAFVPHADLPYLLGGARALLMPSLAEGFGLPILDAFACGVPVLTSACSSMPEVAGDTALYCDPVSPASIAAGMLQILQRQVATALVARGRQRVQQFTWEATATAMCQVYERCLLETGRLQAPYPLPAGRDERGHATQAAGAGAAGRRTATVARGVACH
ncbi:MAG: glycosyltransferase family 4 protein [Phycisphaerae bacterium]|jgi:glycosyltransferase involved in cell wall biosynthesis|nr:glycosyltransferase family 4 protein [Phycisphaerae bacterium]HPC21588.1 glycosyltransferase family 1 protein [Phycisphaerae bacterium]HRT41553.1 glycosyltransferase family 1 protein [Phycisphaerae bacterium]